MSYREHIVIAPASAVDKAQGFPWSWGVFYGSEHRSGACRTREEAEREAAAVLKLLMQRA
jgi:hypothetical protein